MVNDYLKIKIIVNDSPIRNLVIDELSISSLKGTYNGEIPDQESICNVLVTRMINGSYVTLELLGKFNKISSQKFQINFTDISNDTVCKINNIMLANNFIH